MIYNPSFFIPFLVGLTVVLLEFVPRIVTQGQMPGFISGGLRRIFTQPEPIWTAMQELLGEEGISDGYVTWDTPAGTRVKVDMPGTGFCDFPNGTLGTVVGQSWLISFKVRMDCGRVINALPEQFKVVDGPSELVSWRLALYGLAVGMVVRVPNGAFLLEVRGMEDGDVLLAGVADGSLFPAPLGYSRMDPEELIPTRRLRADLTPWEVELWSKTGHPPARATNYLVHRYLELEPDDYWRALPLLAR